MSSRIDELSKELWHRTGIDWHVSYSVTLTKPTCALVSVRSDDKDQPKLNGMLCKSRDPVEAVIEGIEVMISLLPPKQSTE